MVRILIIGRLGDTVVFAAPCYVFAIGIELSALDVFGVSCHLCPNLTLAETATARRGERARCFYRNLSLGIDVNNLCSCRRDVTRR